MTNNKTATKPQGTETAPKSDSVIRLYNERLSALKKAREFSSRGDVAKAVDRYKYYLYALATYHGVEEEKLHPSLFDKNKDLPELLLISHAYWDLAKAYDRAPNLYKEFSRCLDKFALFTKDFRYQHVNSRMLKKFLRRKVAHHPQLFQQTLEKIQVESKGCFIATHAYGEFHPTTQTLREFKLMIAPFFLGRKFIELYYASSPLIVSWFEKNPKLYTICFILMVNPFCKTITQITKAIRSCSSSKS